MYGAPGARNRFRLIAFNSFQIYFFGRGGVSWWGGGGGGVGVDAVEHKLHV